MSDRRLGILATWLLIDAAVAVYLYRYGASAPSTVLLLAASILLVVTVVGHAQAVSERVLTGAAVALLAGHVALRIVVPYRPEMLAPPALIPAFATASLIALIAALAMESRRPGRWLDAALVACVVAGLIARVIVVAIDVAPVFDVDSILKAGGAAVLHGANPYAGTAFDRTYPYMPLSAMTSAISLTFGDVRWPSVAADVVTAVSLIWMARVRGGSSRLGLVMAGLWIWSAGGLYETWQGFPEPIVASTAAVAALSFAARPESARLIGFALAVGVGVKQLGAGFLPFLWVSGGRSREALGWAILGIAAIVAPFLALDAQAFLQGTILQHLAEPSRSYALNLLNLPPGMPVLDVPFPVAAVAGLGFGWLTSRGWSTSVGTWLGGSAAFLLVTFELNPIAFVNYYSLVLIVLLLLVLNEVPAGRAAETEGPTAIGNDSDGRRSKPTRRDDQPAATTEGRTATAASS